MVNEAWDLGFNGNDLEKLIDSMPRRIRAIYEAEGGHVNYWLDVELNYEMHQ